MVNDEVVAGVEQSEGRELVLEVRRQRLGDRNVAEGGEPVGGGAVVGEGQAPEAEHDGARPVDGPRPGCQDDHPRARVRHVQDPGAHAAFGVLERTNPRVVLYQVKLLYCARTRN